MVSRTSGRTTIWYHALRAPGNVSHLTTAAGLVGRTYTYDAFGLLLGQTGTIANRYRFQTKELHANSGLVSFGARWYDPAVGRWLTADPLGLVDGPNLYAYLQNSPVNDEDPWGFCGGTQPKDRDKGKKDEGKGSTEIKERERLGTDGARSRIRLERDADGNVTEVWHEVIGPGGNIIHQHLK